MSPPPPHHHPPHPRALGGKRMSAPGQARIVLPGARISGCRPFSKGLRNASVREGPLATDASHPPPPPFPPRKKESSAARSFARFTRDYAQSRGEEERERGRGTRRTGIETMTISSKRFVSSDRKVLFERLWRKESRFRSVWR